MRLEYMVAAALVMDVFLGDPRWFPHPVRFIGWFAGVAEEKCRSIFRDPGRAGAAVVFSVLLATVLCGAAVIHGAGWLSPLAGNVCSVILLYFCLAGKDLAAHSRAVYQALDADDLDAARGRVGMIVGRDTSVLGCRGVIRACVESVAENTVDGITAPLFWAVMIGPLGALVYKSINTMDSMFGYRDERYADFGRIAARLDDAANFLPARLTGLFMVAAACLLGLRCADSWRVFRRDRLNHASPNAGHAEAAAAGALGIRLGGDGVYYGRLVKKPDLGIDVLKPEPGLILKANSLMTATTVLFVIVLFAARVGVSLLFFKT